MLAKRVELQFADKSFFVHGPFQLNNAAAMANDGRHLLGGDAQAVVAFAVAIQDGWNAARIAQPAGVSLASLVAGFDVEYFGHVPFTFYRAARRGWRAQLCVLGCIAPPLPGVTIDENSSGQAG